MMKQHLLAILFCTSAVFGQDSLQTLSHEELLTWVAEHHPLTSSALLVLDQADAGIMKAKGAFDPTAFAGRYDKYYEDKTYYSLFDAGVEVPLRGPFQLRAGYEQNSGQYLDPENTLPASGLWYGGIEVQLGQGLLIDERRAALQKALIQRELAEQELLLQVNQLLQDASTAYWEWNLAFQKTLLLEEAVQLAADRLDAVRISAVLGDRPSIDTVEAGLLWQQLQIEYQQAEMELTKSRLALSVFLWEDGYTPLLLDPNTVPENEPAIIGQDTPTPVLPAVHPALQSLTFQLEQLEIDRMWQAEKLRPKLKLSYNPLVAANGDIPLAGFSSSNYTWGVGFSMPLFLREARGGLQAVGIYTEQTWLKQQNKTTELQNKSAAYFTEWEVTRSLTDQYRQTVTGYLQLLQGENTLFLNGESSLFLVNSRQLYWVNGRQKLLELEFKEKQALNNLYGNNANYANWYRSRYLQP